MDRERQRQELTRQKTQENNDQLKLTKKGKVQQRVLLSETNLGVLAVRQIRRQEKL